MCEKNGKGPETRAESESGGAESQSCGCPCEPKRCLPVAALLVAAVALPLVVRAVKRSRRGGGEQAETRKTTGCCA